MASRDNLASSEGRSQASPARRLILGIALGLFVGAILAALALKLSAPTPLPELTDDTLATAVSRWDASGPASYDLDVKITGRQPGVVHIEVRDRVVTAMTRDGRTPSQRRTWDYWTVPAQFDTLAADLESARDPEHPFGAPAGTRAILRARFDDRWGYPVQYQRYVLGTDLDVGWEVTRFQVVDGAPVAGDAAPGDAPAGGG